MEIGAIRGGHPEQGCITDRKCRVCTVSLSRLCEEGGNEMPVWRMKESRGQGPQAGKSLSRTPAKNWKNRPSSPNGSELRRENTQPGGTADQTLLTHSPSTQPQLFQEAGTQQRTEYDGDLCKELPFQGREIGDIQDKAYGI